MDEPLRSTPTRVGTTICAPSIRRFLPVHPHARGDNGVILALSAMKGGPPPRAWGQHHHAGQDRRRDRSTPTRVGTTGPTPGTRAHRPVHPHARGDNEAPFGRGHHVVRSTPTRVGTTHHAHVSGGKAAVHPHARGDNDLEVPEDVPRLRSTPTRVGTTPWTCAGVLR